MEELWDIARVAEYLGVSQRTVYTRVCAWLRTGVSGGPAVARAPERARGLARRRAAESEGSRRPFGRRARWRSSDRGSRPLSVRFSDRTAGGGGRGGRAAPVPSATSTARGECIGRPSRAAALLRRAAQPGGRVSGSAGPGRCRSPCGRVLHGRRLPDPGHRPGWRLGTNRRGAWRGVSRAPAATGTTTSLGIVVEVPGGSLSDGERAHVVSVSVAPETAYVLGIEDLIVDRLAACVVWSDEESCRWARVLVKSAEDLDMDYLTRRVREEQSRRRVRRTRAGSVSA